MRTTNDYQIEVQVHSAYVAEQSDPDADRYFFTYTVTIRNVGSIPAQLRSRHWIITDANGNEKEVRGAGVVGEQPHLAPGQSFRYTSATLIETPVGSMHGSYRIMADDGAEFDAEIPAFRLAVPDLLH